MCFAYLALFLLSLSLSCLFPRHRSHPLAHPHSYQHVPLPFHSSPITHLSHVLSFTRFLSSTKTRTLSSSPRGTLLRLSPPMQQFRIEPRRIFPRFDEEKIRATDTRILVSSTRSLLVRPVCSGDLASWSSDRERALLRVDAKIGSFDDGRWPLNNADDDDDDKDDEADDYEDRVVDDDDDDAVAAARGRAESSTSPPRGPCSTASSSSSRFYCT